VQEKADMLVQLRHGCLDLLPCHLLTCNINLAIPLVKATGSWTAGVRIMPWPERRGLVWFAQIRRETPWQATSCSRCACRTCSCCCGSPGTGWGHGTCGSRIPAYGGRYSTGGQADSSLHTLSLRGTDNPSSRYQLAWFYLSTRGSVGPYKIAKEMLPEPLFPTSQNPPLNAWCEIRVCLTFYTWSFSLGCTAHDANHDARPPCCNAHPAF